MENVNHYVGMRNVKTALAVVISMVLANVLQKSDPFLVSTAALLTMQSTVSKGVKVGKDRVLGTVVGAVIGIIMAMIKPGSILLIFVGIVILISVLNVLKWQEAIAIACIVFCSVTFNLEIKDTVGYAISRTIDTTIGIIVSLGINHIIVPPKDSPFYKKWNKIVKKCKR